MKKVPNSVLALDVGIRTLLWVVGKRRGKMLLWGEAGMEALGLGRLLLEPQAKEVLLKQARNKLSELGRKYEQEVERRVGVLTGALRELPEIAGELIKVGAEAGIDLRVIDTKEEGRLAWLGSSDLFPTGAGAVLDLGGLQPSYLMQAMESSIW